MNKIDLLKKMLPGFLPLIVFIIADEIWGTRIGIIAAILFGIVEFIFIYIKEKRLDRFIIVDTLLLVLLGLVSILFDNELFFKLKPALLEVIFCVILGISVFSPTNIILMMTKRYMKDLEISTFQEKQMMRSVKAMFWIFLVHTALIVYSAYFMSKEAWGFISSGLFYILFGAYFVFELVKQKLNLKKYRNEEWLPLVNEEGKVIGKAPRSVCHQDKSMLHPVVHVHVVNARQQIFLQKRPMSKLVQPGKWDTAVGGHLSCDETLEQGLRREVIEELGIENGQFNLISNYVWESNIEQELVYMFYGYYNKTITVNRDEVDEGKFWTIKEIKDNLGKQVFTPNFEHEFSMLTKELKLR